MSLSDDFKFKVLVSAVVVAGVAYAVYRSSDVLKAAGNAINPLNNDNIINQGFTSVYQAVTGSTGTLGTDIYDVTHPEGHGSNSFDNPIYGAYTSYVRKVTGDPHATLGTKIYDWIHGT